MEVIYSTFDELPENHKRVSEISGWLMLTARAICLSSVVFPAFGCATIMPRCPFQQLSREEIEQLDSGETKEGILEIMPEGYGGGRSLMLFT